MRSAFSALLLSCAALPASAQDAPCELHVWPADGMGSVRQRAFESSPSAGLIPALIKQSQQKSADAADERARDNLAASATPEPMSTAVQVEALKSLPLADMLGLPGHVVVVHDTPLESRTIRTVRTRYVETVAPCYADLVVDDVFYARAYANGRTLKTFYRFRDFGAQAAPVRSFGTWVDTKLLIFSIDPPDLSQPALDEIVSAFRTNATRFSELLRKRP
ncbi:hypothetical protein [Sphingomonas sp. G-3-2-10]|uniref:hypothetical protein n=1 Tax=Sphingomonas sp. G-3-2-10 TaxID=2728838 RepID=UPI001469ADA8|nr:hypothetical protein [Sphingomonas sp. G-3-2-10]NML04517.1 hypothetical protein [Sphingomonas sp. G-3-2-10]